MIMMKLWSAVIIKMVHIFFESYVACSYCLRLQYTKELVPKKLNGQIGSQKKNELVGRVHFDVLRGSLSDRSIYGPRTIERDIRSVSVFRV